MTGKLQHEDRDDRKAGEDEKAYREQQHAYEHGVAEHGDRAQAMHHQSHEIHRRASLKPRAALRRQVLDRQPRLKNPRRKIAPDFAHRDDMHEYRPGNQAEIAEVDALAGEEPEGGLVEAVREAE